ncbi:hypothetical protein HGP29_15380 [Flammeovirga sp. SR4]|uniref:Peptidase C14 caspase domain-containing protein n=2 Tax=Flammeovirga agarivorans TaxID=2726742 RepID=A0A7X8XWV7_9BACT|nr:hypothetical protein [Flammeovirga agarivorans]
MNPTRKTIQIGRLMICIGLFFYAALLKAQENNIAITFSQGHLGKVNALDISNDGNLVISSGEDRTIKIWDAGQERLLRTINAHDIAITDISLSRNNEFIVSAGLDHSVKVWSAKNGMLLASLRSLPEAVQEVRFQKNLILYINAQGQVFYWDWSKSNKNELIDWSDELKSGISTFTTFGKQNQTIFLGKFNGDVQEWNVVTKKMKRHHILHNDWVADIVFLKKRKLVVSGSWDGSLVSWNLSTDSTHHNGHLPDGTGVRSMKYSESINQLIVTSLGDHAYIYDIVDDKLVLKEKFEERNIVTTSFNKDGNVAVVAYKSGEISMWEMEGMKLVSSWKPIKTKAKEFSVSLEVGAIAVASEDGNVRLWNVGSRDDLKKIEAHTKDISKLEFLKRGDLLTTSLDSTIKIWEGINNFQKKIEFKHYAPIVHTHVLHNDSSIIFTDDRGDIFLSNPYINPDSARKIHSSFANITAITSNPRKNNVIMAFSDRKIGVLDLDSNKIVNSFSSKDWYIHSMTFSSDGKYLVVGGKNKLSIWDLDSRTLLRSIPVKHKILSVSYTYDNKYLIVSEENGTLKTYTPDLSQEINIYNQSTGNVIQVADFPGKDVFLTLSSDYNVGIWDLASPYKYGGVYTNGDSGWLVEHYSGLFDASESNMKNLYYVVDSEIIDLHQLQDMYWEPGLGTKLFTGNDLRPVPNLHEISLFPSASLYKRENKLIIDVEDRGGGIGRVSVNVNGKEVLSDISKYKSTKPIKKLNIIYQNTSKQRYVVPMDSIKYLFQGGELNDITINVENLDGTLSGRGLTIKHKASKEDKTVPSFYGIVIGVSNYRGNTLDLKYAAKDAEQIAASIEGAATGLFGEHRVNIELFTTDQEEDNYQPTKTNIKNAFDSLATRMNPSDVLFIFMAGHGMSQMEKDGDEDFYFLTKDMITADIKDESIKNNYCIAGKEWIEWMRNIPVTRQVFIMDACNAGKFAETVIAMRNVDEEAIRLRALERVRTRSGMYLLAGAAADKVSYESTMYGQGLLTYSILDYLKSGDLRQGEFLDVQRMFGNSVDEVPRLAERFGAMQQPEMRIPTGGDSFDIGRVTDNVRDNIVLYSTLSRITGSQFEDGQSWLDPLELTKKIDKALLAQSEGKNTGYNSFTFTPNANGSDVYQLRGKYVSSGSGTRLMVKIISDNEVKHSFNVVDADQEKLIDKVIFEVISYFQDI